MKLVDHKDCALVPLRQYDRYEGCQICIRHHDFSGEYDPACRQGKWECGYDCTTGERENGPTHVWMPVVDAVAYRLTGEVYDLHTTQE